MGIDLRLPNITGATDREKLSQMQSYIYQLVEQLQWGLQNVDTTNATVPKPTAKSLEPSVGGGGSIADPQSTFNSIKALIIKSAEIVEAYSEEISKRLEGTYVAQSDFGEYAQSTAQEIVANSESITQTFDNIQIIRNTQEADKTALQGNIDDLGESVEILQNAIIGVTAYVKTGLLDETDAGVPIYGLEVGQTVRDESGEEVFNQYARFTSDRLSFYDSNGSEVAYISDKKLFIRQAEITVALKIGGLTDFVMPSGDVVTKWVGG